MHKGKIAREAFCEVLPLLEVRSTMIICFFTGASIPSCCAPMLREPVPSVGQPFTLLDFPSAFQAAVALNTTIHDGAVMVGRRSVGGKYEVAGWSYRLHPASLILSPRWPNKGSAFNSCLAMSKVDGVDWIGASTSDGVFGFAGGIVYPNEC